MTHGESDSWSIRTLLLLQASNNDSVHMMRDMLCESIQAKYGTRRLKPVPLLGPNSIYMSPDEMLTQKHKTDNQKVQLPDENTVNSNDSASEGSDQDMEMELVCCVCKSNVDHVWNPIVECSECHTGYHKECHEPEIMEDVSDPRVVWYCHNCSKALQSKQKSLPSLTFSNSSKTVSSSGKQSSLSSRSNSPPVSSSFGNKSSFGGKRPLQNKLSVLSSSSSSSSSSGKVHNPKINIISADRRLQIMKKRAARKQDKRSTK